MFVARPRAGPGERISVRFEAPYFPINSTKNTLEFPIIPKLRAVSDAGLKIFRLRRRPGRSPELARSGFRARRRTSSEDHKIPVPIDTIMESQE